MSSAFLPLNMILKVSVVLAHVIGGIRIIPESQLPREARKCGFQIPSLYNIGKAYLEAGMEF